MPVAALLPFLLAIRGIQTNHDAIVQAVDVPIAVNHVGKLCLQARRFPDARCRPIFAWIATDLKEFTSRPVTAGDQYAVAWQEHRHGNVGMSLRPGIVPQELT